MFSKWNFLFVFCFLAMVFLEMDVTNSMPVGEPLDENDKYSGPVMVPVSSTVIPLQLFGKPRPLQGGATPKPRSNSATAYLSAARRMRLLERSRRPEEPVRLITKNSRQKDLNNETH